MRHLVFASRTIYSDLRRPLNVFAILTDDLKCFSSSNLCVASISVFFFLSDSAVNSQGSCLICVSLCVTRVPRGGGNYAPSPMPSLWSTASDLESFETFVCIFIRGGREGEGDITRGRESWGGVTFTLTKDVFSQWSLGGSGRRNDGGGEPHLEITIIIWMMEAACGEGKINK